MGRKELRAWRAREQAVRAAPARRQHEKRSVNATPFKEHQARVAAAREKANDSVSNEVPARDDSTGVSVPGEAVLLPE